MSATEAAVSRAAWLAWRAEGVGSSDVAAAYANIYGGAYKAVATRIGITVDDIDPALADRGHRWEQPIADGVHAHTGLYVAGEQLWLERHDQPRHRATPDGLLIPTPEASIADVLAGLEVKTKAPAAPWQWHYWIAQVQWQMYVADLPRWLLAIATIESEFDPISWALNDEVVSDIRYRWIYADPAMQANLVGLADWLLDHIDNGVLPDPVDAAALPYVKAANKAADPESTADIDDLADLISRYEELKEAAKTADDERATAEAVIRKRMGEATEALTSDGAWRVRVGLPVFKFTSTAEQDFIDLYCTHRDDCPPDCTEHRPDMLVATLYRDMAKAELPDEYEALKIPTPDRRMTIKNMEK